MRMYSLDVQQLNRIRIGPAGWQYPDWEGVVYPTSKPRGFDALEYMASYFDIIEVNSSFYRIPREDVTTRWVERIRHHQRFQFSVKAYQGFTHDSRDLSPDELTDFERSLRPLARADRLGALLLQFPWSFRDGQSTRDRLSKLVDRFTMFPQAIEVRHLSWLEDGAWAFLESLGASVCGIDQPVIGESIPPHRWIQGSAATYFRLHGRNYQDWFRKDAGRDNRYNYDYSEAELAPWLESITRASETGSVAVIFNNHFRGQAPANAFEIASMLSGKSVSAPVPLRRAFPRLKERTNADKDEAGQTGWLFDVD